MPRRREFCEDSRLIMVSQQDMSHFCLCSYPSIHQFTHQFKSKSILKTPWQNNSSKQFWPHANRLLPNGCILHSWNGKYFMLTDKGFTAEALFTLRSIVFAENSRLDSRLFYHGSHCVIMRLDLDFSRDNWVTLCVYFGKELHIASPWALEGGM